MDGLRRAAFNAFGIACVALGILGALLPILPTTPFLLLGGWCFARGNPELGERLLAMRIFRPYRPFLDGSRPIPRRVRFYVIALVWIVVGTSAWVVREKRWLVVVALAAALIGSIVILRFRRTAGPSRGPDGR